MRDDGSVDLSKVTLTVGDQKGGSQALLKAAGAAATTPYKIEWKSFTSGPPLLEALNAGADRPRRRRQHPAAVRGRRQEQPRGRRRRDDGRQGRHDRGARRTPPSRRVADLEGQEGRRRRGQLGQLQPAGPARPRPGCPTPTSRCRTSSRPTPWPRSRAGHVDAWAIWDPYTSQAEIQAKARILADGDGPGERHDLPGRQPRRPRRQGHRRGASRTTSAGWPRRRSGRNTHRTSGPRSGPRRPACPSTVTRRPSTDASRKPVPISTTVIASEQKMADAFVGQRAAARRSSTSATSSPTTSTRPSRAPEEDDA